MLIIAAVIVLVVVLILLFVFAGLPLKLGPWQKEIEKLVPKILGVEKILVTVM